MNLLKILSIMNGIYNKDTGKGQSLFDNCNQIKKRH